MATINATLQRQYQRQQRRARRRHELISWCRNPVVAGVSFFFTLCLVGVLLLTRFHVSSTKPQTISPQTIISQHQSAATQYHTAQHTQVTVQDRTWLGKQNQLVPKYLVWTCAGGGCGGIGDRMFGTLQAYCMGICLGRELIVDWADENVQFHTTTKNQFRPPEVLISALDERSLPVLQHLEGIPEELEVVGIKTNLWMGVDVIRKYNCWDPSVPLDEHEILKSLFTVSSQVKALSHSLKEASGLDAYIPYIGLHARTGIVDGTENHFTKQHTNWTAFVECGLSHCSDLPVYLASDDEYLKQQLAQQYRSNKRFHASALNATTHYAKRSADMSHTLAWAEWYTLAEAKCVLPTFQSKYSLSAGIYAGCLIDSCDGPSNELSKRISCTTTVS